MTSSDARAAGHTVRAAGGRGCPLLQGSPESSSCLLEYGTISLPERALKAAAGRVLCPGDCLADGG